MYRGRLKVGGLFVVIHAFSPNDAPKGLPSWSLKSMQNQQDADNNPRLVDGIYFALHQIGACRAFSPNVVPASAQIIDSTVLKPISLGNNFVLHRDKNIHADGIFLKPGEAFVMSGAGCPIIIATGGDQMIVAHAGRDSLIDRGAVIGNPTRKHVSVVHSIIDAFKEKGIPVSEISMCLEFSIPADVFEHQFDHPQHGEYNRALATFINKKWSGCTLGNGNSMFLDLESVFLKQTIEAGVQRWTAEKSLSEYTEFCHTRDGKDPNRRNLIVVKRYFSH